MAEPEVVPIRTAYVGAPAAPGPCWLRAASSIKASNSRALPTNFCITPAPERVAPRP